MTNSVVQYIMFVWLSAANGNETLTTVNFYSLDACNQAVVYVKQHTSAHSSLNQVYCVPAHKKDYRR